MDAYLAPSISRNPADGAFGHLSAWIPPRRGETKGRGPKPASPLLLRPASFLNTRASFLRAATFERMAREPSGKIIT